MTEKEEEEFMDEFISKVGWICGAIREMNGKLFIGGCGKEVKIKDAYRCTDCTAPFHRKCAKKHFTFPMGKKPKNFNKSKTEITCLSK